MSEKFNSEVAVIGIDIGKNSFHMVGQDRRGPLHLTLHGPLRALGPRAGGSLRPRGGGTTDGDQRGPQHEAAGERQGAARCGESHDRNVCWP